MNGAPEHPSPSLPTVASSDNEPQTAELLEQLDQLTGQTPKQRAERQRLCDEIITRTLPVADRLAAHYGGRGVPMDDLRQVARTALVQATWRRSSIGTPRPP